MTWSIQAIGKPEAVSRAIDRAVEAASGGNRTEMEEFAPALKTLVGGCLGDGVAVKLTASGHGYSENGVKKSGNVSVALDSIYGLVE